MQQAAPSRFVASLKRMLPRSTGCMRVWGMGGRVVPSNSDGYSKLQQLSLLVGFLLTSLTKRAAAQRGGTTINRCLTTAATPTTGQ